MEPDKRDAVVDFVNGWSAKSQISKGQLLSWIGLPRSRYYDWSGRYGKVNEQARMIPRDHWLEAWEKQAIIDYFEQHPLAGYRRLTYRMMDADVVAASPSSVYRVLEPPDCWIAGTPSPVSRARGSRSR